MDELMNQSINQSNNLSVDRSYFRFGGSHTSPTGHMILSYFQYGGPEEHWEKNRCERKAERCKETHEKTYDGNQCLHEKKRNPFNSISIFTFKLSLTKFEVVGAL